MRPQLDPHTLPLLTPHPAVIRFFKPKPIQLPSETDEPLSPTSERSASRRRALSATRNAHNTAKFDLRLARASVALDVGVYTLMLFSTSGLMFAVITACGAVGMGFNPAVHAVALTLYNRRGGQDSGRLFGSLSVVQALRYVESRFRTPCYMTS